MVPQRMQLSRCLLSAAVRHRTIARMTLCCGQETRARLRAPVPFQPLPEYATNCGFTMGSRESPPACHSKRDRRYDHGFIQRCLNPRQPKRQSGSFPCAAPGSTTRSKSGSPRANPLRPPRTSRRPPPTLGSRLNHGTRSIFNGGNPAPVSERRVGWGRTGRNLVRVHERNLQRCQETCGPDHLLFLLHAPC